MFNNLSDRLSGIFDKLKGRGALTEEDVTAALREVRIALLEADVALPVVKDFIAGVKEKAIGQDVLKSVTPGQQVVKIVHDHLVEVLGKEAEPLNLSANPPVVIMMVGLQGSGKTTSTAKIARHLTQKQRKKVLMASLDIYRPAAQDQLKVLGTDNQIATLPIVEGQKPREIAARAMETGKLEGYDVVMLDTAGRLHIDDELMVELEDVKAATKPTEVMLVADAMSGQDAVTVADTFHRRLGLTGITLTRIDGDARGGAALSMRSVTGCPIKFLGVGEQIDKLEEYHPDRVAGRILDMGDVVSLVEKAVETIDQEEAEKIAKKMKKGQFDMNDLASQLKQMEKIGGMSGIMNMLPGIGKMKSKMGEMDIDDKVLKRQLAIISSMTPVEREKVKLLNASRRRRIASGSGTSVQEVNKLLKMHKQVGQMMKKANKLGEKGLKRHGIGSLFKK
ncbi:MAG: signal recognition particle protein [Alphaproteobacteria bacterium]